MAAAACQKCITKGEYFKSTHGMSFHKIGCKNRTDIEFRYRIFQAHHCEDSIIEELPIDMIVVFITSYSLHLLDLGIMKKCLKIWMFRSKYFKYKWTQNDIIRMNNLLKICNNEMPSEIHRSVRNLHTYTFWKGTEFRTFLLYICR